MKPKKIQILDKKELFIKWNDDTETFIDLKYLRDECPCASCKGETVLFKTLRPPSITVKNSNMYEIIDIQLTGGYAIQIKWKDGHGTGIYTWDYLKTLGKEGGQNHNYKPLI
ncbi:MAG: DUF971 domain-containing protein [Ignavibacteriales bacterium]|nr:MAG: DUF971 domain-containing protein [Ignavibacteriales bacterium]